MTNAPAYEVVNIDPSICDDPDDEKCPANAWVKAKSRITGGQLRMREDTKYQDYRIWQQGDDADADDNADGKKRKRKTAISLMFESGPVNLEYDVEVKESKYTAAAPVKNEDGGGDDGGGGTTDSKKKKKPRHTNLWCSAAISLASIPGMVDRMEDVREVLASATSQRIIQDLRKGTADVNINIRSPNDLMSFKIPFNETTSELDIMIMDSDGTSLEGLTKIDRNSTVNIIFICELCLGPKGCNISMTVCQIMLLRASLNKAFLKKTPVFTSPVCTQVLSSNVQPPIVDEETQTGFDGGGGDNNDPEGGKGDNDDNDDDDDDGLSGAMTQKGGGEKMGEEEEEEEAEADSGVGEEGGEHENENVGDGGGDDTEPPTKRRRCKD